MTQAFNLSQLANNVNTAGKLNAAAGLYNQVPVANGGTGQSSFTGNATLITDAAGTTLSAVAAGTSGNVLTSNGTTWVSQTASGGTPIVRTYTSPATWTKPATLKAVKVTVVAGGGSGSGKSPVGAFGLNGGGVGGISFGYIQASAGGLTGPQAITVPSGGAAVGPFTTPATGSAGNPGGTCSFGSLVTATGGSGGPGTPVTVGVTAGTPGAGTSTFSSVTTSSPYVVGLNSLTYPQLFIYQNNSAGNTPTAPTPVSPSLGQNLIGSLGLVIGTGGVGAASGYGASGAAGQTNSFAGAPGIIIVEEFY